MNNRSDNELSCNWGNNVVLIVDDMPENLELLSGLLVDNGFKVRAAIDGKTAIKAVETKQPDLILLDIQMPDMDGYEVCRILRNSRKTIDIPIIFISGLEETEAKVRAFEAGGVDYITKPFQVEEVIARVKTHLSLQKLKKNLEDMVEQRTSKLTRLASAFEQIAEGVIITDPGGMIEYTNPAFEKITGYSNLEVTGKTSAILHSRKHGEEIHQNLWKTILDGKTWSGRIKDKKKDGSFISLDVTIAPIYNDDIEILGYVSITRDVTDQLKIESMLRQAQKMEAIGTLAGGIAHDFNNILSVILGYSEMGIDDDVTDISEMKDYMLQVFDSAIRAKDLVAQILAFSRQTEQTKGSVKVISMVKEVAKFLKASLPSTIRIKLNLNAKNDTILADPTQIHQVLMNLCTNAWHAMKEKGGELKINVDTVIPDSNLKIIYPELEAASYIRIEVNDTGYGIKKEDLESIFIPYFTTKDQGEGTGLGLAVVHGIVTGFKGSIHVRSILGEGTTFEVFFPVYDEEEINEKEKKEKYTSLPKGDETILFIDDEAAIIKIGKISLKSLGYNVIHETDPIKGLELYRKDMDIIDLVITDKTMPKLNGFELAAKIKALRNDVPIILCTGFCDETDVAMCKKSGISDLIMKPIDRKKIATTIRNVLDAKE